MIALESKPFIVDESYWGQIEDVTFTLKIERVFMDKGHGIMEEPIMNIEFHNKLIQYNRKKELILQIKQFVHDNWKEKIGIKS